MPCAELNSARFSSDNSGVKVCARGILLSVGILPAAAFATVRLDLVTVPVTCEVLAGE